MNYFSSRYAPAIAKVKAAGIKNVTRIVVIGQVVIQVKFVLKLIGKKNINMVDDAIKAGSDSIQLDYIRYSSKHLQILNMPKMFTMLSNGFNQK